MAEYLIFNPFLKKGFQYSDDGGGGGSDDKVSKFTSYNDDIEPGQIAQYQGPDDVAHGLKYGNFYQVNQVTTKTIPAGDYWLDTSNGNHYYITKIYTQEEAEAFNRSIPLYGYTGSDGANYSCPLMYYFNLSDVDNFTTNGALCVNQTTHIGYKIKSINYTQISSGLVQIASCTLENDVVLTITQNQGTSATVYGEFTCVETDEIRYSSITTINNEPSFICSADDVFNMAGTYRLFPTRPIGTNFAGSKQHTNEPLIITIGEKFTQIDTQPRTPGVTVVDGVLQISLPVEFSGNITVHGSEVIVTTEQIQSENDFIKLRYNNPLALASGETSGISVNNYDGNNTDCVLAVDATGWARVGDKNGTLQKLATIQDTPTDGAFVKYNNITKELESTTNGSALTVTFTPDTTPSRAIIQTGDTLAAIVQKIAKKVVITPTFINTPSNPDRLKITLNYNMVLISAYDLVFANGLNDGDKICTLPFIPSIQWNYSIYLNNSSGAVNSIYVVSVDGVTSLAIKGTVNAGQGISFTLTVF